MKNILHIAAHMGGGAGKAISGILKQTSNYNNILLLLETPQDTKYIDICRANGVEILVSDNEHNIRIHAQNADVIVLDWWCHPLFFKVLRALNNIEARIILWSHINGLYYPYLPFDFLDAFDACMFTSDCTLENSEWTTEEMLTIKEKSEIVYGMGDFRPSDITAKKDYNISEKCRIAYSGTLNFGKMNTCYPQVCSQITHLFPNTSFEFFGKYEENFRPYFDGLNVNFRGFRTDLEEILPQMDIYCYLLNEKNFATTENALLEAMASGLPVVVMNNPAERNIVIHNENGFIADTPEQVIQYIEKLYNNKQLRCTIGTNARKTVIEKYSYEENFRKYHKCLKQVLSQKTKKINFSKFTDDGVWGFFKCFCGNNYKMDEILSGEAEINLPEIFFESNKSSPEHFIRYYNDEKLIQLAHMLKK